jgi:hypothetical protein
MDCYDVEVGMIGVNDVVMKSDEDEKSWMIDMETNENGQGSVKVVERASVTCSCAKELMKVEK